MVPSLRWLGGGVYRVPVITVWWPAGLHDAAFGGCYASHSLAAGRRARGRFSFASGGDRQLVVGRTSVALDVQIIRAGAEGLLNQLVDVSIATGIGDQRAS